MLFLVELKRHSDFFLQARITLLQAEPEDFKESSYSRVGFCYTLLKKKNFSIVVFTQIKPKSSLNHKMSEMNSLTCQWVEREWKTLIFIIYHDFK